MSAHTPGPWMAHGMNVSVAGIRGTRPPLITVASIYPSNDDNAKQAEADARLIAAAPDLLMVCKAIAAHDYASPEELDALNAAIDKAEGRS